MHRVAAARVLGISDSATRGVARVAYMTLLQRASQDFEPTSVEFAARQAQLKDAYSAFSEDVGEIQDAPSSSSAPATRRKANGFSFLGGDIRTWAILLLVGSLVIAFFTWTTLNGSPESNSSNDPASVTVASDEAAQASTRPSAAPTRTPDDGQSGLLNTCWRDENPVIGGGTNESTPVVQVSCSNSQAQWRVFKETRIVSECSDFYLTTTDGWNLCIRPL